MREKSIILVFVTTLLIGTFSLASIPRFGLAEEPASFKISGYILDSDGHGVAGAMIIFNVPEIVPAVYSDSSGYYVIFAPSGTYRVNVWPPFDSNYLSFDQPAFTVGASDISKNITLSSAYKLSGYLTDPSGAPIRGALVSLNQFHCGWYSDNAGFYFVTAPAGTYKLTIQPKTGPTFLTYNENDFALTSDTVRNFTFTTSGNTPAEPSPAPNSTSTLISITTEARSLQVGSAVNVKGKLTERNGNVLVDKTVILSYTVGNSASWFQIGSDKTNTNGEYNIQWVVGGSGIFTLKAEWPGDASYSGAVNFTKLNFMAYQNQQVFCIESNSTVSALAFNSTSSELSFVVSGPNGTKGYVKATIARNLVSNAEDIKVVLDGNQLSYEVTSNEDSWLLFFTYTHSTHQVKINLETRAIPEFPSWTILPFFSIATLAVIIYRNRLKRRVS